MDVMEDVPNVILLRRFRSRGRSLVVVSDAWAGVGVMSGSTGKRMGEEGGAGVCALSKCEAKRPEEKKAE